LDSVDERCCEVQRRQICSTPCPTRAAYGVRDPRAVAKSVETGSPNLADDMDDERRPSRCGLRDGLERKGRDLGFARRPCLRKTLANQREQRERHTDTYQSGGARDGDRHAVMVAVDRSHVVHAFVKRAHQGVGPVGPTPHAAT
jgi:hypothetical protein